MDHKHKINRILSKKRVSSEQLKELNAFLDHFDKDKDVEKWLQANWNAASGSTTWKKMRESKRIKKQHVFISIGSVAAMLFALWFTYTSWEQSMVDPNVMAQSIHVNEKDKENTEVILERNAQVYNLTENKVQINDSSVLLNSTKNNLKLTIKDKEKVQKVQWNVLKVPVAKDFFVELADGTKVWLNACSKLRFPDQFNGDNRIVELEGEAYFEVKADASHPFYVKTKDAQVIVTGTKFNVYSYSNEKTKAVTLLEGKVTVDKNNKKYKIKPGEQFYDDSEDTGHIRNVDAQKYISWKDGVFEFHDMALRDIALRLEKWYGVKFNFNSTRASNQRFTGMARKSRSLKYFMGVLGKTTNLNFELQESDILVWEKNTNQ